MRKHDPLILPVFEEAGPRQIFGVERGEKLRSREPVLPEEERIDAMPMRRREMREREMREREMREREMREREMRERHTREKE